MFLHLESYKGIPAVINFPLKITLNVTELEDIGISTCSAVLENGMKVRVRSNSSDGGTGCSSVGLEDNHEPSCVASATGVRHPVSAPSLSLRWCGDWLAGWLQVPKHLKQGDKVIIDTRTGEYSGKE